MPSPAWRCAIAVGVWLLVASAAESADIRWRTCPQNARRASPAAMDCGWLTTGETLGGQPVRLRVVVLRARPDARDRHPVVYIPGGPGAGAGIDARALVGWRRWQQRAGWPHDIVLFDPRATGGSTPRPDCDDERRARAGAAEPGNSRHAFAGAARAARRCYARLSARRAAALGPAAQVRDLAALMDALGVERANLWAVSYGTRIARLFARDHPARVRAMVLDSLADSRDAFFALPDQIGGALAQLDRYCARQPACARRDRPSAAVAALLARYDKAPPRLSLPRHGGRSQPFVVTPYRLLMMLVFAGYDPANAPATSARLARARRGDSAALRPLAARLWRRDIGDSRNRAVFWSTRCAFAQDAVTRAAWQQALAAHPVIAPYLAPARAYSVCRFWRVPRVAAQQDATLAAPTLVVAGGADALSPMATARAFAHRHRKARLLAVPDAGHVATFTSACARAAVARFWAAPRAARRHACNG